MSAEQATSPFEQADTDSKATREPQVTKVNRVVFFDLDGTLHQQDMFGSFLRFLLRHLPLNLLLVIPLLPVIGLGLLAGGVAPVGPSACYCGRRPSGGAKPI